MTVHAAVLLTVHAAVLRLADDGHAAGGWGFLIVLALIVASVLLFIAMRSSLSKVPETFDHQPGADDAEDQQPPATGS